METLDEEEINSITDEDSVIACNMAGKFSYDIMLHFTPRNILNEIPRSGGSIIVFRKSEDEIGEYFKFNRCVLDTYNQLIASIMDVDCARWTDFQQLLDQKISGKYDLPTLSLSEAKSRLLAYGCDFGTAERTLSKDNVKFLNKFEIHDTENYCQSEEESCDLDFPEDED